MDSSQFRDPLQAHTPSLDNAFGTNTSTLAERERARAENIGQRRAERMGPQERMDYVSGGLDADGKYDPVLAEKKLAANNLANRRNAFNVHISRVSPEAAARLSAGQQAYDRKAQAKLTAFSGAPGFPQPTTTVTQHGVVKSRPGRPGEGPGKVLGADGTWQTLTRNIARR